MRNRISLVKEDHPGLKKVASKVTQFDHSVVQLVTSLTDIMRKQNAADIS